MLKRLVTGCFGSVNASSAARVDIVAVGDAAAQDNREKGQINDMTASLSLKGRPPKYQKRVSKKEKRRIELEQAKEQEMEEEAMAKYLGKSASCSSLNSLNSMPRALSTGSLRRCQTPERHANDVVVMFDDDGGLIVKGRRSPYLTDTDSTPESRSEISLAIRMLGTPEMSDAGNLLESIDFSSHTDLSPINDCNEDDPEESEVLIDNIEPALSRVLNPMSDQPIENSCFKEQADKYKGQVVGRTILKENGRIRRNVSWSHFSEISFPSVTRSSSELSLAKRRHTVLVLTNEDDLEDQISESGDSKAADEIDGEEKSSNTQRKLSHVYESHHVHLSKLHEQMGDSTKPPEDLMELMARKMFTTHASYVDLTPVEDKQEECDESLGSTTSHDLSECSSKLPKIKTKI